MTGLARRFHRMQIYAAFATIGGWLNSIIAWYAWYATCANRAHERRMLTRLDDRMLKDIGISRLDAMREANRPFWDAGLMSRDSISPRRRHPR